MRSIGLSVTHSAVSTFQCPSPHSSAPPAVHPALGGRALAALDRKNGVRSDASPLEGWKSGARSTVTSTCLSPVSTVHWLTTVSRSRARCIDATLFDVRSSEPAPSASSSNTFGAEVACAVLADDLEGRLRRAAVRRVREKHHHEAGVPQDLGHRVRDRLVAGVVIADLDLRLGVVAGIREPVVGRGVTREQVLELIERRVDHVRAAGIVDGARLGRDQVRHHVADLPERSHTDAAFRAERIQKNRVADLLELGEIVDAIPDVTAVGADGAVRRIEPAR